VSGLTRLDIEFTMKNEISGATAREWQQLGFFYDRDDQARTWTLTGSRAGLLRFSDALRAYVTDARNAQISEHEHYGPYMYLKVMTSPDAAVDKEGIRGSLSDLARLATLVESKLASVQAGERVRIQDEFASNSSYELILDVRQDAFDPSSADPALWE
jgi:hypothetical protein